MARKLTGAWMAVACCFGGSCAQRHLSGRSGERIAIQLLLDASRARQGILHSRLRIPLAAGDRTLFYPKWIPGEHGPTGPIDKIAGLSISANGHRIGWQRDGVDMYAFHLRVPEGANTVEVELDFLAMASPGAFISGASLGETFAVINWNELLLYPETADKSGIQVQTELRLPQGWHFASALEAEPQSAGDAIRFAPVSLDALVDSPLICGQHLREYRLSSLSAAPHYIDLVADRESDLRLSESQIESYSRLVDQAWLLFGSHHYESYRFLISLGDEMGSSGLEHRQSSDDRMPASSFSDPLLARLQAWLLPHEFVHSWNGKYRRPAGLTTPNFQTPMRGDLLWVYEGLTTYLGDVLATRVGLWTPDEFREELALKAAEMNDRPGRSWRNLLDTAVSAQILSGHGGPYGSWRRGVDYYAEGELIWLDVDALIREKSGGRLSLEQFCRRFFGGAKDRREASTYTFGDLVSALNQTVEFDWGGYFHRLLTTHDGGAALAGLARAGYEIAFQQAPSEMERLHEKFDGHVDARFSFGAMVKMNGEVEDVLFDAPFYMAGVAPGDRLAAINGERFSADLLRQVSSGTVPGSFTIRNAAGSSARVIRIAASGRHSYPVLRRIAGVPDLISQIVQRLRRPQ